MSMLSEASAAYAKDRSREAYDELIVALMLGVTRKDQVLAPAQIVQNAQGVPDAQFGRVQASDGKWYYVICSCPEELMKLGGGVTLQLADMLRMVKSEEQAGGLCIDPANGAHCIVSKEDALVLLDNLANNETTEFMEGGPSNG